MSTLLGGSVLLASCLLAVGCASDGSELPSVSADENSADFRIARTALSQSALEHTGLVMSRERLSDVTLDELHFHEQSLSSLSEMEWQLRLLGKCVRYDGKALDTAGSLATVRQLGVELEAHEISMITMVDQDTAKAAEMAFEARQAPLFDELEAYDVSYRSMAADYNCAF